MAQLLAVLVAIGLMAAMVTASVQYVDPVMQQAGPWTERLERAFLELQRGHEAYKAATGSLPNALADITPRYVFLPAAPPGMSWDYGSGGASGTGRYFCLSGAAGPAVFEALGRLTGRLSPQAYFRDGAQCGVTADNPPPGGGNSTTVFVTYWVESYL